MYMYAIYKINMNELKRVRNIWNMPLTLSLSFCFMKGMTMVSTMLMYQGWLIR